MTTIFNTLALDPDTWDLTVDANGNIAVATPPYALAQDVASAVRTFLGEVWYDTTQGIPYWTQVLGKLPPAALLIEMINNAALSVIGVSTVQTILTGFSERGITGIIEFVDVNNVTSTVSF